MQFLLDISADRLSEDLSRFFIKKPDTDLHLSGIDFEFMAWGDPLSCAEFEHLLPVRRSIEFIVNNLYGHYYFVFWDKSKQEFLAGNSMFSILPLYYCTVDGRVILSDNALTIGRHLRMSTVSRRFILESVLFNYPLFNHSVIDGISLLPANSGMVINRSGFHINRHTSVEEWFHHNPSHGGKSADRLADIFLEEVKKYLPEEHYFNALTGGFDGRTLAAAGKYHKRSFSCYCFGASESNDLSLADTLASKTGTSFFPVNLDDEYLRDYSLEAGKSFIINSSGAGTFTRAHYIYAANVLSGKTRHLISGNFGSEIFRAVHVPGVVISPNLYKIFSSRNPGEANKAIRKSIAISFLNQKEFTTQLEDLEMDIGSLPCFNTKYSQLSRNEQFYVFVFEELFRKYFGAEMISQFGVIKIRTPFLDPAFLKELMSTGYAGIHSKFFEGNPFRRYKGQVMYAHIIRKACPQMGNMMTDKGYTPDDLLSVSGKLHIARGYMRKLLKGRDYMYDPNGVRRAWDLNHSFYEYLPVNESLFDKAGKMSERNSGLTDALAKYYSLIYIDNYLNKL